MRNKKLEEIFPDITGIGIDDDYIETTLAASGTTGSVNRANIVNDVLTNTEMLVKIAKNPNIVKTDPEAKEF